MDAINTLLVQRSANYSDRIQSPLLGCNSRHSWSLAFMNCGQKWRDHRRTFHRFFNRKEEIPTFLKALVSRPDDFREATHHFFGTIIMRAAYGDDDPEYNKKLTTEADRFLARFLEVMTPGKFLVGFLPSMQHIPSWTLLYGNDRFISVPFEDTKARMSCPEEDSLDFDYKEEVAKNTCAAAYLVSTALSVMLALTMYPDVQRKAQEQVDSAWARIVFLSSADFEKLPYLQAVIKEAGRWHAVVPLALPHVSVEEDIYNGCESQRVPWSCQMAGECSELGLSTLAKRTEGRSCTTRRTLSIPSNSSPNVTLKSNGQIDSAVLDHHSTSFGYGRSMIEPAEGQKEPLTLRTSSSAVSYPLPFECKIEPRSQHYVSLINNL
ncbi:cytochrome P450 [Coprinopsis sp. MPI-PUGE-AT-0042]|nr:cytochrome P450 [Coprinopsis sp. MPI-PUGE-AT-0042]